MPSSEKSPGEHLSAIWHFKDKENERMSIIRNLTTMKRKALHSSNRQAAPHQGSAPPPAKLEPQGRRLTMQFHSEPSAENIKLGATSRFQRRMTRLANAAGIVAITGLSLSSALATSDEQELQQSDGHRACTLATLKGRYLFAASGVLLPPAFGVVVPTQAADAGFHVFNGMAPERTP
jgi:hypothetical protein